jgi:hypothetical protein
MKNTSPPPAVIIAAFTIAILILTWIAASRDARSQPYIYAPDTYKIACPTLMARMVLSTAREV